MFLGLFGKKKEQEPQLDFYAANIDDVETGEQLRELVKIIIRSIGNEKGNVVIREDYLDEFPELAKISHLKDKVE